MYLCVCVTVIIKEEVINLLGSGGKETREKLEGGYNHVNTILMHEILKKKKGLKKFKTSKPAHSWYLSISARELVKNSFLVSDRIVAA